MVRVYDELYNSEELKNIQLGHTSWQIKACHALDSRAQTVSKQTRLIPEKELYVPSASYGINLYQIAESLLSQTIQNGLYWSSKANLGDFIRPS